jgi:two-component system chemotaxis response regulator CheB
MHTPTSVAEDAVAPCPPVRVLVVDDTLIQRRLVSAVLAAEPVVQIVGTAADGLAALDRIEVLRPDVVVLDIEMPRLDGLGVLRELRLRGLRPAVVMYSTLSERGARITFEALALGAADYALKPHGAASREAALAQVRSELVPKVLALGRLNAAMISSGVSDLPAPRRSGALAQSREVLQSRGSARGAQDLATPLTGGAPAGPPAVQPSRPGRTPVEAVVIAASTGGPEALSRVLAALPADFPVPVLVVQHMPAMFTRLMAERLDALCALRVREAEAGSPVLPGDIWIARGGEHLRVRRNGSLVHLGLDAGPAVHSVRPAADILFQTAVTVWGAGTLAVVLTGMGVDGRDGSDAVVAAGGRVVVQDPASSVVWGMPGAVAHEGLADAVLPLDEIAAAIENRVRAVVAPELQNSSAAGPSGGASR